MGILLIETATQAFYALMLICGIAVVVGIIKLWRDISAAAYKEEWEKQYKEEDDD